MRRGRTDDHGDLARPHRADPMPDEPTIGPVTARHGTPQRVEGPQGGRDVALVKEPADRLGPDPVRSDHSLEDDDPAEPAA